MFRQGDVLLIPIYRVPENYQHIPVDGPIVLAHGEATGHAHTVDGAMLFHGPMGEVIIDVTEHTEVKHQEHTAIPLEIGFYRVVRQREYTPEAIRNVAD